MTTLKGGSQTFDLSPGEVLIVSAIGEGSVGHVSLDSAAGAVPAVSATVTAGTSQTIGPFAVACSIKVYSVGRCSVTRDSGVVSGGGNFGRRLALIGDSRHANGYLVSTPSAVSVAGSVASVTSTNVGLSVAVGDQITLGKCTGCTYIRATVATIADNDNITANINFPIAGLPSGAIRNSSSVLVLRGTRRPTYPTTFAAWLLMLLGQPFETVDCYAFNGARSDEVLDGQIPDALGIGFDSVWLFDTVNDYMSSGDNKSADYCIAKYKDIVSRVGGRAVWLFLEPPLSGATYDTAANRSRIQAINAWARTAGVRVVDFYSALDDGSGAAKAGWLFDGLHTGLKGSLGGALATYQMMGLPVYHRAATAIGAGSNRFPLANPTFSGILGASQMPTGYSRSTQGLITETGYGLQAKADGTGNEWYADMVTTGAAQYMFRSAGTPVTAGVKYRVRFRIQIIGMVGLEYMEITLRNQTGDASIGGLMTNNSSSLQLIGDADGTYAISGEQDLVIPAGVTSAYYRPRLYFDGAGGGRVVYSDVTFEAVT